MVSAPPFSAGVVVFIFSFPFRSLLRCCDCVFVVSTAEAMPLASAESIRKLAKAAAVSTFTGTSAQATAMESAAVKARAVAAAGKKIKGLYATPHHDAGNSGGENSGGDSGSGSGGPGGGYKKVRQFRSAKQMEEQLMEVEVRHTAECRHI